MQAIDVLIQLSPENVTALADELTALQAEVNPGMGVNCVRTMIHYLRRKDFASAIVCRQTEGDKTRAYPVLEKRLTDIFGCRCHGRTMCVDWDTYLNKILSR